MPAAADRYARLPLAELVAPAIALARRGVEVNASQAFLFKILRPIYESTQEARAHFMPAGLPRPRATSTATRRSPTRSSGSPPTVPRRSTPATSPPPSATGWASAAGS